jgi:hypothetical protein
MHRPKNHQDCKRPQFESYLQLVPVLHAIVKGHNLKAIYNTTGKKSILPMNCIDINTIQLGDKIIFTGASDDQVNWGSHRVERRDPRKLLEIGETYELESMDIHSWHTNITLVGIEDSYNSTHFCTPEQYENQDNDD